jgi:uncharacterized protein GlcG (DUF336 family)
MRATAVVDTHGFLVAFEKMSDAQTASVEIANDDRQAARQADAPRRFSVRMPTPPPAARFCKNFVGR